MPFGVSKPKTIPSTYPVYRTGLDKHDFRVFRESQSWSDHEYTYSVRDASLMCQFAISADVAKYAFDIARHASRSFAYEAKRKGAR